MRIHSAYSIIRMTFFYRLKKLHLYIFMKEIHFIGLFFFFFLFFLYSCFNLKNLLNFDGNLDLCIRSLMHTFCACAVGTSL